MLVYDITKERTFDNISKWIGNIEMVCMSFMYSKYCQVLLNNAFVYFCYIACLH